MEYQSDSSSSVDDEMQINLYENPINRESLEKIPGTNTYEQEKHILL